MEIRLEGADRLLKKLDRLKKGVRNKIVRRALMKASTPILKSAKARVPVDSKTLKKSLGRKSKTYKNGNVVVVIGARGNVRNPDGKKPTRYAHLAERSQPFIRPAYDENRSAAQGIIQREIASGIEVEVGH